MDQPPLSATEQALMVREALQRHRQYKRLLAELMGEDPAAHAAKGKHLLAKVQAYKLALKCGVRDAATRDKACSALDDLTDWIAEEQRRTFALKCSSKYHRH